MPNALFQASPYVTLLKDTLKSTATSAAPSAVTSTVAGITSPIATSTLGGADTFANKLFAEATKGITNNSANYLNNAA
nr:MAG TPA: hypothetical protein [Caudoviricetes sp.]